MIKQYFKQAWNLMKQEKLFSSIYILGTGLAVSMVMGLAIVMVSLLTNVYPETNRDRMLVVDHAMMSYPDGNQRMAPLSESTIHTCFDRMEDVEALSLYRSSNKDKVQLPQSMEQMGAVMKWVDVDFWKVFNFRFLQGKPFTEADFRSGLPVAVVSESLARSVFGSIEVIGKEISFALRHYRICGVVKDVSAISPISYAQLWAPYTSRENYKRDESWDETGTLGFYNAYILVKEGADIRAVKREGQERIRRYSQTLGDGYEFSCMDRPDTFVESFFHQKNEFAVDFTRVYIALALLFLALLLVPAINLSGMTESRMERRLAELGVRRSFGASVRVLVRQVVTENLLFTFLGGIVGLFLSYMLIGFVGDWLFRMILGWDFPKGESICLQPEIFLNIPVFLITLLVCFLLNLLSAVVPAWRSSRHPIVESLHPMVGVNLIAGTGMSFFQRMRKNAWIGIELMLVFGLLWVMTDFFLMRVYNRSIPVCRTIDKVWNVQIAVLPQHHPDYDKEADRPDNRLADYRRMIAGIRQDADVEEVAALHYFGMPYRGSFAGNQYRNVKDTTKTAYGEMIAIDPETDYFRVFGYTTADGKPVSVKDFDWSDPHGIVLGQRTAKALLATGNVMNQVLQNKYDPQTEVRVKGVVGDVKRFDYERPEHAFYEPFRLTGDDLGESAVAVRLKPNVSERKFAEEFEPRIRKAVQYGNFYVKDVKSFKQLRQEAEENSSITGESSLGITMFLFFYVNIILCVLGTFWYRVQMRREEIGVRMALGASRTAIRKMLYREGLVLLTMVAVPALLIELQLVFTGIVPYGLPGGAEAEYLLDYPAVRFLVTNALTWLMLALCIVGAISIPAHRIVRISPADAMRDE